MATILERFHDLGLPKNKSSLSWAGTRVAEAYCKSSAQGRKYKTQIEDGEKLQVWDYPASFTPDIDSIIKNMIANG